MKPKTVASTLNARATKELEEELKQELQDDSEELSLAELRSTGLLKEENARTRDTRQNL